MIPQPLWWLSFISGRTFKGACVVEAVDVERALSRAKSLGIYPGGRTLGSKIPPDCRGGFFCFKDQLFTRTEAERIYKANSSPVILN